jgi:hypothetical protein
LVSTVSVLPISLTHRTIFAQKTLIHDFPGKGGSYSTNILQMQSDGIGIG